MPGRAGGGHSGGFSGGGSHGSSGGGHSGSFGGSGRSSSGFSGGSSRSYSSGSRGGYRRSYSRGGRGVSGGCTGLTGILLFVPIILIAVIFALGDNVVSYFRNGNDGYRSVETYEEVTDHLEGRDPLDASLCTPADVWMESSIDGYLSAADEATITGALQYFYKNTGVQPYFILTDRIGDNTDPGYDDADVYLYDKYIELFGEDEGHYILLMVLDPAAGTYTTWYIPGYDAETVIDSDGSDILLTYIDRNAENGDMPAAAISSALRQTADDLIHGVDVTRSEVSRELVEDTDGRDFTKMISSAALLLVIFGGGLAAVIVLSGKARKKKKTAIAAADYRMGEDTPPARPAQPQTYRPYPGGAAQTNIPTPGGAAQSASAPDFPVVCPVCGANAYTDANGCCQYCGTKLK